MAHLNASVVRSNVLEKPNNCKTGKDAIAFLRSSEVDWATKVHFNCGLLRRSINRL